MNRQKYLLMVGQIADKYTTDIAHATLHAIAVQMDICRCCMIHNLDQCDRCGYNNAIDEP